MYVCVHRHAHTCVYVNTYEQVHVYTHEHVCALRYMHVCIRLHVHVCTWYTCAIDKRVHTYVYGHMYMQACMHVWAHICTGMYAHVGVHVYYMNTRVRPFTGMCACMCVWRVRICYVYVATDTGMCTHVHARLPRYRPAHLPALHPAFGVSITAAC